MANKLIQIILLQLVFVLINSQYTENDARNYVSEVNEKLYKYYDEISDITFGKIEAEYHEQLPTLKTIANNIAELIKRAQQYPVQQYQDNELKLAIKNIQTSAYLLILGQQYYENITEIVTQLKMTITEPNLCEFESKNHQNCHLAYLPDIRRLIINSNTKPNELKYYWQEWRQHNQHVGKTVFPKFIQLLLNAAAETGVPPLSLWYHIYGSESNLIEEMEKVMAEIQPFYQKIHAYVRFELNRVYGDDIISETDLIPHHLYEMIIYQAWKKDGVLEQAFPHKKLPNLKSAMDAHGLHGPDNIIKAADEFYSSLGLKSSTHNYITAGIFTKKPKEKFGRDCKAELYDKTPSIRLEYCPQSNFRKFLQNHGWMARIYYANQKKYLPYAFYQSYEMEQALGEAGILSASTPKHIQNIGILPNYTYTQEHLQNRLFRMGVHTWFNIPAYFVHVKIMDDLLSGKVKIANLNDHYWNLMKLYVGVKRPIPATSTDAFDFPHKFYEGLENNEQTTKFISEIAGYQIYKSLCLETGEYVKNSHQHPLHNCDFGGKNLHDILTNMMSIGSKQTWRQVLSQVTKDSNGLNGQALIEYYQPLEIWLDHNVKFYNYPVGWH